MVAFIINSRLDSIISRDTDQAWEGSKQDPDRWWVKNIEMEETELVSLCLEAACESEESVGKWRRQRRTLERLPSHLAQSLLQRLLHRRLLFPSLLEYVSLYLFSLRILVTEVRESGFFILWELDRYVKVLEDLLVFYFIWFFACLAPVRVWWEIFREFEFQSCCGFESKQDRDEIRCSNSIFQS